MGEHRPLLAEGTGRAYVLFGMKGKRVVKVLIQTRDGRFLVRQDEGWGLTRDCANAAVFEYPASHFAEELGGIPAAYGSVFYLVPAEALDVYEMCDRCGRLIRPSKAFFDGRQFLCPECGTNPLSPHAPADLTDCGLRQAGN